MERFSDAGSTPAASTKESPVNKAFAGLLLLKITHFITHFLKISENLVDILSSYGSFPFNFVPIGAEGVHAFGVANQTFHFSFWESFNHRNEGMAQGVKGNRRNPIGFAVFAVFSENTGFP